MFFYFTNTPNPVVLTLCFGLRGIARELSTRAFLMELQDGILHIQSFLAVTIGIIVLFVGKRING